MVKSAGGTVTVTTVVRDGAEGASDGGRVVTRGEVRGGGGRDDTGAVADPRT